MTKYGIDALIKIEINGFEFSKSFQMKDINSLEFGKSFSLTSDNDDIVRLIINDQNNSRKSLFRDSSGNALSSDNFEEISKKFALFFSGQWAKARTSNDIKLVYRFETFFI